MCLVDGEVQGVLGEFAVFVRGLGEALGRVESRGQSSGLVCFDVLFSGERVCRVACALPVEEILAKRVQPLATGYRRANSSLSRAFCP